MKVLFIVVLIVQLLLMNFFVASSSPLWGLDILMGLFNGRDWRQTGLFPRVSFCDLSTRDVGQPRHHTVQCVLMMNMVGGGECTMTLDRSDGVRRLQFAEKIYVFLWLWTYALLAVMCVNIVTWIYRTASMASKMRLVRDALRVCATVLPNILHAPALNALQLHRVRPSDSEIRAFILNFLKSDGVLVLRLIQSNAGYVHMADILYELYTNYSSSASFPGFSRRRIT